jgi:transcriptional regulator with XRE-family HTH domain
MDLTFGARLRSQREQQQVALATIAEETKISVALLEGLERDDLSRWPGGLFRRAYVRTYAQKIGLDPEQVVREFIELHPDAVAGTSPVEVLAQTAGSSKRPKTRIGFLIAGLAGLRPQRSEANRRIVTPEVYSPEEDTAEHTAVVHTPVPGEVPLMAGPASIASQMMPEPAPQEAAAVEGQQEELQEPTPRAKLLKVPSPDATSESRRDGRMLERSVVAAARLCTRIACARDDRDLNSALEETVGMLDAQGAILWAWDPDRDALFPVLAHGYPDELLSKLPEVGRRDGNAIADAFSCGQKQVVRGEGDATGAFVAPLLSPDGCVGVLALEFSNGAEQHELVQALATLVTAQFSTLFAATPQASLEEEWVRPDRTLVAS